jgi:hypothetical protein
VEMATTAGVAGGGGDNPTGSGARSGGGAGGEVRSAEQVRALPVETIIAQLEELLVAVAAQGPSPLTAPLDRNAPVTALGLDSMTIVQFKGVLEKR